MRALIFYTFFTIVFSYSLFGQQENPFKKKYKYQLNQRLQTGSIDCLPEENTQSQGYQRHTCTENTIFLVTNSNDISRKFFKVEKVYTTKLKEEKYFIVWNFENHVLYKKLIEVGSNSIDFDSIGLIESIIKYNQKDYLKKQTFIKNNQNYHDSLSKIYTPLHKKIAPYSKALNTFKYKRDWLKRKNETEKIGQINLKIDSIKKKMAPIEKEYKPIAKLFVPISYQMRSAKYFIKRIDQLSDGKTIDYLILGLVKVDPNKNYEEKDLSEVNGRVLQINHQKHREIKETLYNLDPPVTAEDHLIFAELYLKYDCFPDAYHHVQLALELSPEDPKALKMQKILLCLSGIYNPGNVDRKPVIYLYPEKTDTVQVKLNYKGHFTFTYPQYNIGWKVVAQPDGKLLNLADSTEHNYLFWEGEAHHNFHEKLNGKEGFVFKGSESVEFLKKVLPQYGLLPHEYNDFIVYWAPYLMKNKYNYVNFYLNKDYDKIAEIETTPKAESILRLFMVYRSLETPIQVENPTITNTPRKGFTLVEWGGAEYVPFSMSFK